jgi:arylsulfatase A-like enzyme
LGGARALLLALVSAGCAESADPVPARSAAAPAARPDIVLVLIDTLRPDYLGLGGAAAETAPFLAELAGKSILFRHAHSTSSWTAPATASVFTGRYPPQHGVTKGFLAQGGGREEGEEAGAQSLELHSLPTGLPTLAERLRDAGYQTLGVAGNVNLGTELGFQRGFERFSCERQADAEALAATLSAWRAELDPARPCFTYVHLNDVHKPYVPRAPWYQAGADDEDAARYQSEIRYVDESLRALFTTMQWGEDTARLVISDHGEAFGEHGQRGHGLSLHGEVNRVLMILAPAGWAGGARVVEENVSLLDVRPTALALAGLEEAPGRAEGPELVGRSLLAFAAGGEREAFARRALFAHRGNPGRALWAVLSGEWKLIEDERDGRRQLFDTRADPGELSDQSADRPEVVARLAAELERFRAAARPIGSADVEVELDPATLRHLSELGYVEGPGEDE